MRRVLRALFRTELVGSRRRLLTLVVVLLLLPAAVAGSSALFGSVLPRDAPVAVVGGEDVTATDREVARNAAGLFSEPVAYESAAAARRALERERVYAVVTVPPGLADREVAAVTVRVTVDGDLTPYREPARALAAVLEGSLDRSLEKRVTVETRTLGPERELSSYLLPTLLFVLVTAVAFGYVPHAFAREERALDRLRVEASLPAAVGVKLAVLAALLVVPIGVFAAASAWFGYGTRLWAPAAVAAYLLTFLALAAVATAVAFLTRFSTAGRLGNVLVAFAVLGASGVVYPAGFFSPLRRELIRLVPTHYAIVAIRGVALKGHDAARYADWLAGLVALVAVAAVPLALAIRGYERNP